MQKLLFRLRMPSLKKNDWFGFQIKEDIAVGREGNERADDIPDLKSAYASSSTLSKTILSRGVAGQ